jgi:uncharacterized membrane protein YkvA (DUF1232 family)
LRKSILSNIETIERWKQRVKLLKAETYALYLAYRDPRVPWYSKAFAALVVGYAFSPIDLIPDFIPILGYLDDLILVPIGITIALKMIPDEIMEECRVNAREALKDGRPTNWAAAIVIIGIWILLAAMLILLIVRTINAS